MQIYNIYIGELRIQSLLQTLSLLLLATLSAPYNQPGPFAGYSFASITSFQLHNIPVYYLHPLSLSPAFSKQLSTSKNSLIWVVVSPIDLKKKKKREKEKEKWLSLPHEGPTQ